MQYPGTLNSGCEGFVWQDNPTRTDFNSTKVSLRSSKSNTTPYLAWRSSKANTRTYLAACSRTSQHSAQGLPESGLLSIATCGMEQAHHGLVLLVLVVLFTRPWQAQSRELHGPLQPSGIAAADVGIQAGSGSLRHLLQSPFCPDGCLPEACQQSSTRGGLRCGQCANNLVVDHVSGLCGEKDGVSVSCVPGVLELSSLALLCCLHLFHCISR